MLIYFLFEWIGEKKNNNSFADSFYFYCVIFHEAAVVAYSLSDCGILCINRARSQYGWHIHTDTDTAYHTYNISMHTIHLHARHNPFSHHEAAIPSTETTHAHWYTHSNTPTLSPVSFYRLSQPFELLHWAMMNKTHLCVCVRVTAEHVMVVLWVQPRFLVSVSDDFDQMTTFC